jgi:opacity protein-like surface antigen
MMRTVTWITIVTVIFLAATSYAQDIPGKWVVGVKGGWGFLADEIITNTDGESGPIVSGMIAYSPTDFSYLGLDIEWETHKLEPGVSGHFTTVSLIPFAEIRFNVSKVFIPYSFVGVGVNINSKTDAKIDSCITVVGFSPVPNPVLPCDLEPENTLALKLGGGADYFITSALALNTEIMWKMNKGDSELCIEGSGCPGTFSILKRDFDANVFMILFGIRYYFG